MFSTLFKIAKCFKRSAWFVGVFLLLASKLMGRALSTVVGCPGEYGVGSVGASMADKFCWKKVAPIDIAGTITNCGM